MQTAPNRSTRQAAKPRIFAHRGSQLLAPENTARAFELASSLGADVLEIDVRLSRDKQVIVIHDSTVDRTTDGHGRVRELSWQHLKRLDAGHRFVDLHGRSARGQGVRLMRLDELLEMVADPHDPVPGRGDSIGINIDIKDRSLEATERVAQIIEPWLDRLWLNVGSFHVPVIRRLRPRLPTLSTSACLPEVAALYFKRHMPGWSPAVSPASMAYRWLQIPPRWRGLPLASRPFIDFAHRHERKIAYWTINDPGQMRRLLARGAHALVTDRPDLLVPIVRQMDSGIHHLNGSASEPSP